MSALPNPFLDAVGVVMPSAEQAAASMPPSQGDAAADPSPTEKGGAEEAPAAFANPLAAGATDSLGCDISDVSELFHFARLLCAQARIHPKTISSEAVAVAEEIRAYEAAYYDPPPLFLRDRRVA